MTNSSKVWRLTKYLLVVAILVGTGFLVITKFKASDSSTQTNTLKPVVQTQPTAKIVSESLTSRLLFMGDTYWGRSVNLTAQKSSLKEQYPFSRLHEFSRDKYDGWIANLECPSVPGVNQPYSLEVEKLLFNCPSTYLKQASKWFTAFSLANNHSANQGGETGVKATRAALGTSGIQYFGDYNPNDLNNVCEIISVSAHIKKSDGSAQTGTLPIATCGYHALSYVPSAKSLAAMQAYSKYMPVFAYPHMGVEYTAKPTSAQVNLYHSMINNGADAVFGGHPHWIQPAEIYKNKLIIYSMGDFMFDQLPGETQRGAAIDLTLSLAAGATTEQNLSKWLVLGSSCKAFHDDCLNQIKKLSLQKLPLTFHYEIVGVSATKTPGPASSAETKLILDRLNWKTVGPQINNIQ